MGTIATVALVGRYSAAEADTITDGAFEWMRRVEQACTRFDPRSELMQLCGRVGTPVPAGPILFEAVRFALQVAEESGGAFDPAVGQAMESRGFDREYSSGRVVRTPGAVQGSYRDVRLDAAAQSITLLAPILLDLGAVAKGMAIDLAARELSAAGNFSVDAGGDLYLGGCNDENEPWAIGIRHPRRKGAILGTVRVSDRAVCTSGDYERLGPDGRSHILDPRPLKSISKAISTTVIAPTAMAADALATAAHVLGPIDGIRFLERLGVDGLIVSADLAEYATQGMTRDYCLGAPALL